jgi:CheY-like chemotaxis protein
MTKSLADYNRSASVLVVEDSSEDRDLLARQLRRGGLGDHVEFIGDGPGAWEYLTQSGVQQPGQIIALFLDLNLPGMSGLELLRRLRKDERYTDLPVIVMTSSNDPDDLDECQKLNVAHYISKPVTFASFSRAVATAFDMGSCESRLPAIHLGE